MNYSKQNLNFHRTFGPEREHISRLLELASGMTPMTKEEIFSQTGIPTGRSSGKVEPHIRYAVFMGLLKDKVTQGRYVLERTPLGDILWRNDPNLVEVLSQLICHSSITRPIQGAPLWHFLFHKAIPVLGRNLAIGTINQAVSIEFQISKVNLSPFKTCYTKDKSFGALRILEADGLHWNFRPLDYRSEFRYVYAFTLLSAWEVQMANRSELTIDEIEGVLGWGRPFIWGRREVMNTLDSLADLGIIGLNKQLTPITIIRRSDSVSAREKMFSLLF